MKKILFMIPNLMYGGAEKVLVNLVNNMDKEKFDVTVETIFDIGVNKQFLNEDIHYEYCFKHLIRGNSYLLKLFSPKYLYKKFIRSDYDIIISYLEGPTARIISGCNNPHTKLVSWIHVQQSNKKIASKAFRNYKEALQCYRKFDQIVCVSQEVKDDFLNLFPLKNSCIVLYNTNETTEIIEKSNEKIDDVIFDNKNINIIGVGKLLPNKGFDRLVHIHKRLIDEGVKLNSYILGVGEMENKLKQLIEKNNIQDSFFLLGYKINPYKYLRKCDLFVCLSYAEGFSTAATESLIVGTPVLTTPVAGMKEMLGNNEYGLIIDKNNDEEIYRELKKMLLDKNLLDYYRLQAKLRGKYFSKENTVKAVEEMLLNLCEE